jgi:hypothetical protein
MLREREQRPVEMFSDRLVGGATDVLVVTKLTLSISRSLSRCSVVPRGHSAGASEAGHRRDSRCVTLFRACSRYLDRWVSADPRTSNRMHRVNVDYVIHTGSSTGRYSKLKADGISIF